MFQRALVAVKFGTTNDDYSNLASRSSLISRQYPIVLPIFLVSYVVLQFIMAYASTMANPNAAPMGKVAENIHYCCGFAFFVSTAQQMMKLFEVRSGSSEASNRGIYYANMCVNMIAGSSAWLTAYYRWGGTCTNVFGVETVTSQWAEWLTSVPLIVYMAVAIKDSPTMTLEDITIVVCSAFAVIFGFLTNFNTMPLGLGIFLVLCGGFSLSMCLGLALLSSWRRMKTVSIDSRSRGQDFDDLISQAIKQRTLAVLLFWVFPPFPIIYILGIVKVFDRDAIFIAFQIAGVAAKLLFVGSIADAHMGGSVSCFYHIATPHLMPTSFSVVLSFLTDCGTFLTPSPHLHLHVFCSFAARIVSCALQVCPASSTS